LLASLAISAGCTSAFSRLPTKRGPIDREATADAPGSWGNFPTRPQIVRFASAPGTGPDGQRIDVELEGRMYGPGTAGMNAVGRRERAGEGATSGKTGLHAGAPIAWPRSGVEGVTIVFAHGVSDNNASAMPQMFAWAGYRVFQFDYRGFGHSTPAMLSATDLAADTLAAVRYVRSRPDVDPARVVLVGHSLGGMMTVLAAAELEAAGEPLAAAIALAPVADTRRALNRLAPIVGWLTGGIDGPQATEAVRRVQRTPLLIAHPADDNVLAVDQAQRLFDASRESGGRALLLLLPTGGHVSTFLSYPSFEAPIIGWLVQTLTPEAAKDWPGATPPIDDRQFLRRR
jgi:pimeloyl-ACP methyl ester carboxylesterase